VLAHEALLQMRDPHKLMQAKYMYFGSTFSLKATVS